MRYKQTQVYLDPAEHARLKAEAQRRGISLAELMRQVAATYVGERAAAYGDKSWDAIIAVADGEPSDVAGESALYERQAADALYEKKMSDAPGRKRQRTRTS